MPPHIHQNHKPPPHQLEFAIGRDKTDCTIAVKLAELDALVELAIVDLDGVGAAVLAAGA
ncbi:hypothetical protein BC936DRAFT_148003 [Jimgerdemannia flammicorona]|uniref:Uncharacterized protein n=2 Tax=Jimgerdemannia flammicorona TaxID=994334 RepID=A0A433D425_9FUNG|nr:hypothetical protein BC936DRAFT_148003 [Jimgerdemannia flammicorona]RUS34842.1 hypothetical protein BC938DRAFT_478235 [Jimgerdemannia flammicorona]